MRIRGSNYKRILWSEFVRFCSNLPFSFGKSVSTSLIKRRRSPVPNLLCVVRFPQSTTMTSASFVNSFTCSSRAPTLHPFTTVSTATSLRPGNGRSSRPLVTRISSPSLVVCKAVSVKPQTEIEGLNIAEDVTQVSLTEFASLWMGCWKFLHLLSFSLGYTCLDELFRCFYRCS